MSSNLKYAVSGNKVYVNKNLSYQQAYQLPTGYQDFNVSSF